MVAHSGSMRVVLVAAVAATLTFSSWAHGAFPAPTQAHPATDAVATFAIDYNNVQSYSNTIYWDGGDNDGYPLVYWVKYHSDGKTAVELDTFGTTIQTQLGSGGATLGSKNSTEIAVYTAAGQKVAISKADLDVTGSVSAINPNQAHTTGNTDWYTPQELSHLHLVPQPISNPHWSVSPTSTTLYQGWSAPGNEGNSQLFYANPNPAYHDTRPTYDPTTNTNPYWYTDLNEYQVWSTSLNQYVTDKNGNIVYRTYNSAGGYYVYGSAVDPNNKQPTPNPGWHYSDYTKLGPASSWNRYGALAEGDYYIAVSSTNLTFQGDTYNETYLQQPLFYSGSTGPMKILNAPLGTFQYYAGNPSYGTTFFGTLQLNITQHLIGDATGDSLLSVSDYLTLDTSFLLGKVNPQWADGDFNADGLVNYIDYSILDQMFYAQNPGLASAYISEHAQEFGAAYLATLDPSILTPAAVPEPTTIVFLSGGALLMLKRHSRKARA